MRCIASHPPSISSVLTYGKSNQHFFNSVKSLIPSNTSKASFLRQRLHQPDGLSTTKAVPPALFIAATSPPNSGDFSVLFQTGAVMLFMYWIANFVVPEFVMKDLLRDEEKKDDEKLSEDEAGTKPRTTAGSGTKGRGFGSQRQ